MDPNELKWWALALVGARLAGGAEKEADKRIDAHLYFREDARNGKTKQIIISTKLDHLKPGDVRDVPRVVDREKAEIVVLITLVERTKAMRVKIASARFYQSDWG